MSLLLAARALAGLQKFPCARVFNNIDARGLRDFGSLSSTKRVPRRDAQSWIRPRIRIHDRAAPARANMSGTTSTTSATAFRLPLDVKPTHYDIAIRTDLEKLEFQGFATVDLEVLQETESVTFNASGLNIHDVKVYSEALKAEQVQSAQSVDDKAERVTVRFASALTVGSKAQLRVRYDAKLTGDMLGYYYTSYKDDQGKRHYYTLTQFEPTMARRAFPCWDEPLLKATYNITLVSRADTVNLSNMPAASEEPYVPAASQPGTVQKLFEALKLVDADKGWKVTRFEKTPPMSSYLVAFANGPFTYLESSYTSHLSGKRRPLRIYATPDLIDQAQFGLDVKAKVLPVYEKVFDIEFPLPKLDTLVAHDFDAGAMENWGLITGRTTAYLVDPKRADIQSKKQIASTQSHEVAHMWFGDITTMSWWDNLWLNEGFASLMGEVIILNKVFPEWKVYSAFHTAHTEAALMLDAKRSSHPIQVDVPDANDINQIFDDLSYSKAASVLRMLSVYVGEEKFLKGVSIYLKKHLYANSVAEDLWAGIQEATNLDIPELMTNWTSKIGFPVLRVTENAEGVRIRQDRFLETGDATDAENETIWQVPLNVLTTNADGKPVIDNQALLKTRETTYKLDVNKPWKINAGSTGVYRVLYTPERLSKIGEEAARPGSVFSLEDRLGLVSDALILASSGLAKTSSALTLIDSLRGESEYLVWSGMSQHLSRFLSVWWEQHPALEDLKAFQRALFTPIVHKLGYEYSDKDSVDVTQLRTLAVTNALAAESKEVVEKLEAWFQQFVSSGKESHIPPDLVRPTFIAGGRYGGRSEWEALRNVYFHPSNPSAKTAAMLGMSSTRQPELIEATFQFLKDSTQDQDVRYFFIGMSMNVASRRKLAQYLQENYDYLDKRFEGNYTLKDLIKYSSSGLTRREDADELEQFFRGKDTSKFGLGLAQSLDTIRAKAAWIERSKDDVAAWLAEWKEKKS